MNILTYQTIVPEVEILEKGLRINSEKYIERLTACRDVYDREGIHPKTTIDFDSFFKKVFIVPNLSKDATIEVGYIDGYEVQAHSHGFDAKTGEVSCDVIPTAMTPTGKHICGVTCIGFYDEKKYAENLLEELMSEYEE